MSDDRKLRENSVRKMMLHVHQSQVASTCPVSSTYMLSQFNHKLNKSLLANQVQRPRLKELFLCRLSTCTPPPPRRLTLSSKVLPFRKVSILTPLQCLGSREDSAADQKCRMHQSLLHNKLHLFQTLHSTPDVESGSSLRSRWCSSTRRYD